LHILTWNKVRKYIFATNKCLDKKTKRTTVCRECFSRLGKKKDATYLLASIQCMSSKSSSVVWSHSNPAVLAQLDVLHVSLHMTVHISTVKFSVVENHTFQDYNEEELALTMK